MPPPPPAGLQPFSVALDRYHGPFDLLLYLLRQHELDIHDIAIAQVAEQFQQFLTTLQQLHWLRLEIAGEFLVLAARLLEMKSRLLLPELAEEAAPTPPATSVEESHRQLVQQLIEYKKVKQAAAALEQQAILAQVRHPRWEERATAEPASPWPRLRPVELWDLVAAFARLLREVQPAELIPWTTDDVPQQRYEQELLHRLQHTPRLTFTQLFTPPYERLRLIGLFLALLELIRRQCVLLELDDAGTIWLAANPLPPASEAPPTPATLPQPEATQTTIDATAKPFVAPPATEPPPDGAPPADHAAA